MSQTVDTNVLLYASNSDAQEHTRAVALIERLMSGPELVVILWPTIMGYLRIATHPAVFTRPLTPAEAMANVEAMVGRAHVRTVGESPRFWAAYTRVTEEVSPRGNDVPDAHLVAMMLDQGVRTIWTRDRGFRRFRGIEVRDPFDGSSSV